MLDFETYEFERSNGTSTPNSKFVSMSSSSLIYGILSINMTCLPPKPKYIELYYIPNRLENFVRLFANILYFNSIIIY